MQDSKKSGPTGNRNNQPEPEDASPDRDSGVHAGDSANADGWQQYRKWISSAPAPRRGNADPALFTWKGYRNWTEQIKRDWPDS